MGFSLCKAVVTDFTSRRSPATRRLHDRHTFATLDAAGQPTDGILPPARTARRNAGYISRTRNGLEHLRRPEGRGRVSVCGYTRL